MEPDQDFYVRVISSACLDTCPENTLSSFKNILSTPIYVPKANGWKVGLEELICNNEFRSDIKSCFLKVKCDQINPKFEIKKYLTYTSRKPYHPKTNRILHLTPKNIEYFELTSDFISEISIKLSVRYAKTDGQKSEIPKIEIGEPTIVLLHFKKFNMNRDSHIIRVSNRGLDGTLQPSNHFFYSLPPILSMLTDQNNQARWGVALTSINFDQNFITLDNKKTNYC